MMRFITISLAFILLFCCSENRAQDHNTIDSVKFEIQITDSPSKKIDLLTKASKTSRDMGLLDEAFEFATEALNIASDEGLQKKQVLAMLELASVYNDKNEFKKAFGFAIEAKELADLNSFELESSEVSLLLSQLYFIMGEYDHSVEVAFNTLKIFEEQDDYYKLSKSLELIGRNYAVIGKDSLSRTYFLKAIGMARTHKNYTTLGVALVNLSNSYYFDKQYEEAIDLLKESCKLLLIHKNNASAIGTSYSNIALIYLDLKQQDSTLSYLQKSEEFNRRTNNFRNMVNTHNVYAFYYKTINNPQKFLDHAYQAFSISKTNNFRLEEQTISGLLEDFYLTKHQMDSAYKYRCIQHDISDVINSQNTLTKMAQLEMVKELEISKKEKIIEERRRAFISIIVFIILLSLLILAFVLLRNYRTKAKFFKLKQEKLEDEISFKNKEMTIQLMDLTKRNELLADITKELITVSKSAQKEETKSAINKIAIEIEKATEGRIWEEFILRFKEVHSGFYNNLIEKFPKLSPNELRLCAFLKLNLSTKEILSMTGQSERSIVMARHRLRKKLGILSQDINLVSFISKI